MLKYLIIVYTQPFLNSNFLEILKNVPDMTWTPEIPDQFKYYSINQVKQLILPQKQVISQQKTKYLESAPNSFSWLDLKPSCMAVHDQGNCASCWALSAVGSFSDNRCISGTDNNRVEFSAQYMISCDTSDFGCDGGYVTASLLFLRLTGVPTEECVNYTGASTTCPTLCDDGRQMFLVKSEPFEDVCAGEDSIKAALQKGTVVSSLVVYEDFLYYKSGIYEHKTGSLQGGHTVVFVGYGVENGVKYWVVRNTYGPKWGENGYFRIKRGVSECGIEDQCFLIYKEEAK
ncbi:Cathepsin_B [Hexamita inflata]|uniref:Cathepsin B n=1 Tax=Hexamita inflata TaxID=28002 RepID=A0AA86NF70_9EUKA|nr:Cathepsin B [Hexamita inflata]CAI9923069.1 Cathepsin B [Hexamita inflata]